MNSVQYILSKRPLSLEDKLAIKKLGRPTPDLEIKHVKVGKAREFNRYFRRENSYEKFSWMCGCPITNRLYCFVCLLGNDVVRPSPWIEVGVCDLHHLKERAVKHANSAGHLNHLVNFNVLGGTDIRQQLDSVYLEAIQIHNNKVDRNKHMLRRLIMCVKFCGAFELALRGFDDKGDSPIFHSLVDFASELDSVLSEHLTQTSVFKESAQTIQNEILDAMLQVCKNEITEQVRKANFLALEVDESTDAFDQQQYVMILRYVYNGQLFERFWTFIQGIDRVVQELDGLGISTSKLIAQSYDGTPGGIQIVVQEKYPNASLVHCYAHKFNLILEKAASYNKKLKIFFANVRGFANFFSESSLRTTILDEIVKKKLPGAVPTRWNFKTQTINILYEKRELFRECLHKIIFVDDTNDGTTISKANCLLIILDSTDFNYFLEVLHCITPHVEIFFNQVQFREADGEYIRNCVRKLESQITLIRDRKVDEITQRMDDPKRPRLEPSYQQIAKDYCDTLITHLKDRYNFTGHLSAASLFCSEMFMTYRGKFPETAFEETMLAYPYLEKAKLKTELSVIYDRDDMCCKGVLPFLAFLKKNHLQEGLSEVYKLLDIICTTPMTNCESGRCFSTLKRIKCFLKNTMWQERLNALAMLSIEKRMIQAIPDFDNKVIEIFARSKHRRFDFQYK